MVEGHQLPTPEIRELLSRWRAAERAWEGRKPEDPGYRDASIDVLRAWLAYQAATEALDPGTFALVVDDERRYVAVSDGVTDVLGYAPSELIGRRIEDIAAEELRPMTAAQWASFIAAGRQDGSYRLHASDGSVVDVRFSARAHHPLPGFHVSRITASAAAGPAR